MSPARPSAPRLGLVLPTWGTRAGGPAAWADLRALARDAEALGVATLWAPDHLLRRTRDREVGFHECWTVLAAVAAVTDRAEVGPFVSCTAFRSPGLLARQAVGLDVVSGGRAVLGLGPGDPRTDASWGAFGYPADRPVARHAEAVEAVARLVRGERVTLEGTFHRLEDAVVLPPGPRAGGPPVWVAAGGERTLALAARWADVVTVNEPLPDEAAAGAVAARVRGAIAAAGRDPEAVGVSGWARLALDPAGTAAARPGWLAGTPDQTARTLRGMAAAGVGHVTLYAGTDGDPGPVPALARPVLDRLRPLLEALGA